MGPPLSRVDRGIDPHAQYFVAFQVSDPEISENVLKVQKKIMSRPVTTIRNIKSGHDFQQTFLPVEQLHVTLYILNHLKDEDVETAKTLLRIVRDKVKDEFVKNPLDVRFKGIHHWGDKVLFAKIDGKEDLERVKKLSELIKTELKKAGFHPDGLRNYTPHMTFAMMRRAKKMYRKIKTFPKELWVKDKFQNFGQQRLNGFDLLEARLNNKTKYYVKVAEYKFNN